MPRSSPNQFSKDIGLLMCKKNMKSARKWCFFLMLKLNPLYWHLVTSLPASFLLPQLLHFLVIKQFLFIPVPFILYSPSISLPTLANPCHQAHSFHISFPTFVSASTINWCYIPRKIPHTIQWEACDVFLENVTGLWHCVTIVNDSIYAAFLACSSISFSQ